MPVRSRAEWLVLIGHESCFDQRSTSFAPPEKRSRCVGFRPRQYIASRYQEDFSKGPEHIADFLIANYTSSLGEPSGGTTPYAEWFSTLLLQLAMNPRQIAAVSEYETTRIWLHTMSHDMNTVLGPPETHSPAPVEARTYDREPYPDSAVALAQPRPASLPLLVWPDVQQSDSDVDTWFEEYASGADVPLAPTMHWPSDTLFLEQLKNNDPCVLLDCPICFEPESFVLALEYEALDATPPALIPKAGACAYCGFVAPETARLLLEDLFGLQLTDELLRATRDEYGSE